MATKRVVVTGASSGIGAATVRRFREQGWAVVGVARRADRLAELKAETGADVFTADLTRQADVDALRDYLAESGPVHALVNNAGGAMGLDSVEDSRTEDWAWMFEINVLAVKRVTSALLPLLRDGIRMDGGCADIVTVTSIAGHVAYLGGGGYNAAKFAAHALMEVLRLELNGEPIRVIEVAPGMVQTEEFGLVRFRGDAEKAAAAYANVPNPLTAEDIAETIVSSVERPAHVNLDLIVIKPVAQAAPTRIARGPLTPKD
ncbi:SDR family oxidoreductase [Cryobacterium sp. TMT1-21]|uniref:SDR family oxidoreductase n=1 Tax=Cryobacterium shii TaxID=1259235 RepID=A0AAQ2HEF6_9MICO|nr:MULTISPECIES: SDR family oxidoreductase [Cryobacterium]TFC42476.1 SDR family oxidoreductase [Cryobacterium shii]TFC80808.1 SDR family oxidoreductase [Cryobacterium sp. TmT2-59]TFD13264.1 SDR family oxidoreductase [Cryobacterium sp. TMT1-21]TFD18685.1 SDR family oxidoreductase [Cryobacterium sp. TMT4-10]TFD28487.1 SDR family oxidoreductase [Cryobacterium sp. TMT2-23]